MVEYVKRACEGCGIILPQPEMKKLTIDKLVSESTGGSVDFLSIPGNQSMASGGYSPSKASKTRADINPTKTYQKVEAWYCSKCYDENKPSSTWKIFKWMLGFTAAVFLSLLRR
jgi:hypothetical protein